MSSDPIDPLMGNAMTRLINAGYGVLRQVISHAPVPGQYVVADLVGRALSHAQGAAAIEIGSYPVVLDLRDQIQRQVYFGIYEPGVTHLLRRLLHPGSVFYDVGANVGYFSFLASSIVGMAGEVHAFEPVPVNTERIRQNISRVSDSNILVNDVAVADRPGTITLFVSDGSANSGWASIVSSARRPRQIIVPSIRLDDYVLSDERRLPDVVKMDIEGCEPSALTGMSNILRLDQSPDLIIEVNSYLLQKEGLTPGNILEPLSAFGYQTYRIAARGLEPIRNDYMVDLQDVFATKRAETLSSVLLRSNRERR